MGWWGLHWHRWHWHCGWQWYLHRWWWTHWHRHRHAYWTYQWYWYSVMITEYGYVWKGVWVGEESRMALARVRLTLCVKDANCPAGKRRVSKSDYNCIKCEAGRYREYSENEADQYSCQLCPAGKTEGADSDRKSESSSCKEDCSPGYYCPAGSASSTLKCAEGFYCPSGTKKHDDKIKCHAGYYCPKGSGRGDHPDRLCKSGYYCPAGSKDKYGKGTMESQGDNYNQKKFCRCGFYCPSGSGSATPYECKDSRSSHQGSTTTVYCPKGSSRPLKIHNGDGFGYVGSNPVGSDYVNGPFCSRKKVQKGHFSTDKTLLEGHFNGKQCPAGRYGPVVGLQSCDQYYCTSGFFCKAGSSRNEGEMCGEGKTGDRYTAEYPAKVYCPRGASQRLYASELGDFTTASDKPGWTADTAPAEGLYLAKRSGLAKCPKNYVCIHGARAPALLWLTNDREDSCGTRVGKNAHRTSTYITEIPDDVNMGSLSEQGEYIDGNEKTFPLKLDNRFEANLEYEDVDGDFGEPLYFVTDNFEGNAFWEGRRGSENGVIALKTGNGLDYEAVGGKMRKLQITARVEFTKLPGKYIETQKSCNVKVKVRTSNDSPVMYENQILNIEEYSPIDTLLMTPVAASDPDEISAAQTFQFQITQTTDVLGNPISSGQTPFTIGRCSGILKVKNDVLRYNSIEYYKLNIELKDADNNEDKFHLDPCEANYGYCQKSTQGTVLVRIRNRNDRPVCNALDNIFEIPEHSQIGQEIGKLKYFDEDEGDTHSFRISQIDGHDAISIEKNTGTFNVFRRLNYEKKSKYSIKVVVTDSGGWRRVPLSAETNVTFNIIDENDAPVLPTSSTFSIEENRGVSTVIENDFPGIGIGEDEDDQNGNDTPFGGRLTYTCEQSVTPDCNNFRMINDDSKSGIETLQSFDFEKKSTYVLSIVAKDASNMKSTSSMTTTIEVLDLNEAPQINSQSFTVSEDVAKGHVFGDILVCTTNGDDVCNDPDDKQSHQFSIVSPDDLPFSIDVETGQLSTTDNLDHEEDPEYSLTIAVTDDGVGKKEDTATWTITVTDVNEKPTLEDNQEREVNEDAENGQRVNKVYTSGVNQTKNDILVWTDPEDEALTGQYEFTITSGDPDEIFEVSSTGQVLVKNKDKLDFEDKEKFTLLIKVNDSEKSSSASVSVYIRDQNEPPKLKKKKDAQGDEIATVERDIDEKSTTKKKLVTSFCAKTMMKK